MGNKRFKIKYKPSAIYTLNNLALYLIGQGYPETAFKFTEQLYEFGHQLGLNPFMYSVCRFKKFADLNLHCAAFKKYVFIYKINKSDVIIYNIVHSSWLH